MPQLFSPTQKTSYFKNTFYCIREVVGLIFYVLVRLPFIFSEKMWQKVKARRIQKKLSRLPTFEALRSYTQQFFSIKKPFRNSYLSQQQLLEHYHQECLRVGHRDSYSTHILDLISVFKSDPKRKQQALSPYVIIEIMKNMAIEDFTPLLHYVKSQDRKQKFIYSLYEATVEAPYKESNYPLLLEHLSALLQWCPEGFKHTTASVGGSSDMYDTLFEFPDFDKPLERIFLHLVSGQYEENPNFDTKSYKIFRKEAITLMFQALTPEEAAYFTYTVIPRNNVSMFGGEAGLSPELIELVAALEQSFYTKNTLEAHIPIAKENLSSSALKGRTQKI